VTVLIIDSRQLSGSVDVAIVESQQLSEYTGVTSTFSCKGRTQVQGQRAFAPVVAINQRLISIVT
jgi:hypothetical protein